MKFRSFVCVAFVSLAFVLPGCGVGSVITAAKVGKNLMEKDSHLVVMLDGQLAKQNKLKKAAKGHANYEVKEPVSTSPTLQYDIEDPERFGRITMVSVSIFQKFEEDYSGQAEYTVFASDINNPQAQMRAGNAYNLGNPGGAFKTINLTGQTVGGVTLQPGKKYMLTLTVKADRSETAQIYFETR